LADTTSRQGAQQAFYVTYPLLTGDERAANRLSGSRRAHFLFFDCGLLDGSRHCGHGHQGARNLVEQLVRILFFGQRL
jgi:hypothetical protein